MKDISQSMMQYTKVEIRRNRNPPEIREPLPCGTCTIEAVLRCSRCKMTHYCNKKCQKKDWIYHKQRCFSLRYQYEFERDVNFDKSTKNVPPYNDSIELLNEIVEKIRPNAEETNAATQVISRLFEKALVNEMSIKNRLFKCIFKELYYSGSSGEGSKIENACEFDLNFVLDITQLHHAFELKRCETCPPGYLMVQMKASDDLILINDFEVSGDGDSSKEKFKKRSENNKKPFSSLYDIPFLHSTSEVDRHSPNFIGNSAGTNYAHFENMRQHYIIDPNAFRAWFSRIVMTCINANEKSTNFMQIFESLGIEKVFDVADCGPALTMVFQMKSGTKIDVDLVPVLTFQPSLLEFYSEVWENINHPKWLDYHPKEFKENVLGALKSHFYLVPKPLVEEYHAWRIDFHHVEKQILSEYNVVRKIIMLMKHFRNLNPPLHTIFSSYSLKTIVLRMIRDHVSILWQEYYLDKVLAICLRRMWKPLINMLKKWWHGKWTGILIGGHDEFWNNHRKTLEMEHEFILGIEGGIEDFFVRGMNHSLGRNLEVIKDGSGSGVFGCCSQIERLIDNNLTRDDWHRYFRPHSQNLESFVKLLKANMGQDSFDKCFGNRLDLMMEFNSTNPNHNLGRSDVNCSCNVCKQKQETLKEYNMNNFFFPQKDTKLFEPRLKDDLKSDCVYESSNEFFRFYDCDD